MTEIREKLSGVFAPMVTPFSDDNILWDGLIANVKKMNETGLRGYFVLGTNGEYKSLTIEERFEVLKVVSDHRSADKVVMAGTGAESTRQTIALSLRAAELGVDMVSLLMPHFFAKKMDDDVLAGFIADVADASPVPVILYNNPAVAAGVTIGPELVKRISAHPNVVGMKDSSRTTYRSNLEAAGEGFYVLSGSANYFFDGLMAGGQGGVLSLANVFPQACVRLYRLFREGKLDEARRLNEELVGLNKEVSGTYGVAGVKAAMDLAGFTGGAPRKPLRPLERAQMDELKGVLTARGFLE